MRDDLCAAAAARRAAQLITRSQGLIWTAGLMYNLLHYFNIPIHVQEVRCVGPSQGVCTRACPQSARPALRHAPAPPCRRRAESLEARAQVCVFTAPLFSAFCALATYAFVKEVRGQGAGLIASAFIAMVPSYISRSVAGSFDNEGVAIFALVFVFFLYIKARSLARRPVVPVGLLRPAPAVRMLVSMCAVRHARCSAHKPPPPTTARAPQ